MTEELETLVLSSIAKFRVHDDSDNFFGPLFNIEIWDGEKEGEYEASANCYLNSHIDGMVGFENLVEVYFTIQAPSIEYIPEIEIKDICY